MAVVELDADETNIPQTKKKSAGVGATAKGYVKNYAEKAIKNELSVSSPLIDFMQASLIEVFPGWLWALPFFTALLILGYFFPETEMFQPWDKMAKFTHSKAEANIYKWGVIILDIIFIAAIVLLIMATLIQFCTGVSGLAASAINSVTGGNFPYCQVLSAYK